MAHPACGVGPSGPAERDKHHSVNRVPDIHKKAISIGGLPLLSVFLPSSCPFIFPLYLSRQALATAKTIAAHVPVSQDGLIQQKGGCGR